MSSRLTQPPSSPKVPTAKLSSLVDLFLFGCGVIFKVNVTEKETVLYHFVGGTKGGSPMQAKLVRGVGGVILGTTPNRCRGRGESYKRLHPGPRNLYGATSSGGHGYGLVFKLTPSATGEWQEKVVLSFRDKSGADPDGGLTFDKSGKLFGTTYGDGPIYGVNTATFGTVFEITP